MTKGMKKTYADQCLERAEKATEGPWKRVIQGKVFHKDSIVLTTNEFGNSSEPRHYLNADFVVHARTDVPELARRLKEACTILNSIGIPTDELESDIEKEK